MTFENYINNPQLVFATEIFNAKANSVEEMQRAINKANERGKCFTAILNKYANLYEKIVKKERDLHSFENTLQKLCDFNNSHEAKLIADFIQNGNEDALMELKAMLEKENPFEIRIVPAWKNGDGERMYGVPYSEFFSIGYTHTYYKYDNWDLQSDIDNHKACINETKQKLCYLNRCRNQMLHKYSKSLSILDDSRYEDYVYYDEY